MEIGSKDGMNRWRKRRRWKYSNERSGVRERERKKGELMDGVRTVQGKSVNALEKERWRREGRNDKEREHEGGRK